MKEITGISVPVLLDHDLAVAGQYDLMPKPGQPMGGMSGIGQMGFVIIDARGIVRIQRVDVNFGDHADQMLEILGLIEEQAA